jgi:uncharacterized protein
MNSCHIVFILIDLHIPYAQSLKDKRQPVRSLKQRLKNRFNISIAEIDALDEWKRVVYGVTMISNDKRYLDKQSSLIEQMVLEVTEFELITFDREFL